MAKKRFASVSDMLHDLSGDDQFNKDFDESVAKRQLVKYLVALRSVKGISQTEVAKALECTQSRMSKIENGLDDDLRWADLKAYAKALGMDIGLVFFNQHRTVVDEVKFHAFRIKRLLDRLAKSSQWYAGIAHGCATFFSEGFFNIVKLLQDSAEKLPQRPQKGEPHVFIHCPEVAAEQPENVSETYEPLQKWLQAFERLKEGVVFLGAQPPDWPDWLPKPKAAESRAAELAGRAPQTSSRRPSEAQNLAKIIFEEE